MKISLQWLREFVDIEVSPQQLADDLTNVGVVVEAVEPLGSDFILGLDLTTNRPDCLSHWGVAREVATLYQKPLRRSEVVLEESGAMACNQVTVDIEAPQLCARYCARVILGVKVAPSPEWLKLRLETLGVRAINNVADATNYVLMEMGHPLHAFDLAKLGGSTIIVREARDHENLVTIDGVERKLSRGMLTIADRTRPVALAGIMGGAESEIGFTTRDILLESAWFDPVSIRKTAKSLGMHTEASHRFERGADVNATIPAIDRAASLIRELAGGDISRGVIDCYPRPAKREPAFLRQSRITRLMGSEVPRSDVERILSMLDFKILQKSSGGWQIDLPTSRLDVEREIDLIEEVARHYGYDKFPSSLPAWKGSSRRRPEQMLQRALRESLIHLGYSETITYSFIDEAVGRKFSELRPVRVSNALSSETEVMRTSLLPGLLRSLLWNYHRGLRNLRLFEMGKIYFQESNGQPGEEPYLALLASGNSQEKSVHTTSGNSQQKSVHTKHRAFFDLKGDIETLLESVGISGNEVSFGKALKEPLAFVPGYYHPRLSVTFSFQGRPGGVLGQLQPKIWEEYKQPVWAAEIPLHLWHDLRFVEKVFNEMPKFPSIQRDISLVVETSVTYGEIESTIRHAAIKEIQRVFPFDLYEGEQLPPGKKGISITIFYQASDRTLVEEEVNRYHETIIALLAEKLGAQLRT
jgi:phenylalanyl-tRNA synthetase beta chain